MTATDIVEICHVMNRLIVKDKVITKEVCKILMFHVAEKL